MAIWDFHQGTCQALCTLVVYICKKYFGLTIRKWTKPKQAQTISLFFHFMLLSLSFLENRNDGQPRPIIIFKSVHICQDKEQRKTRRKGHLSVNSINWLYTHDMNGWPTHPSPATLQKFSIRISNIHNNNQGLETESNDKQTRAPLIREHKGLLKLELDYAISSLMLSRWFPQIFSVKSYHIWVTKCK